MKGGMKNPRLYLGNADFSHVKQRARLKPSVPLWKPLLFDMKSAQLLKVAKPLLLTSVINGGITISYNTSA